MDARERVEAIKGWIQGDPQYRTRMGVIWEAVEAAIRAAENEALERAAVEVEQPLSRLDTLSGPFVDGFSRLLSCVLRAMAANVRSLKTKETP